jgi:hypothetical protein
VACKQMVGLFATVWARRELVPHVGHVRFSCVGRGIMGCLSNKGCTRPACASCAATWRPGML